MSRIVGVDGCRAGWLAVTRSADGETSSAVFADAASLFDAYVDATLIAIDIPIGLPASGTRACDVEARRLLGRRGSSVFAAPIRAVLDATSYEDANALSRAVDGKGLSKQTWNICAKIREVDRVLRGDSSLASRTIEVHPESSFSAWAGGVLETKKKDAAGIAARRSLVESWAGAGVFDAVRTPYLKKQVADDDINDAFAALWSGARVVRGDAIVLGDETRDACGLPMRICV